MVISYLFRNYSNQINASPVINMICQLSPVINMIILPDLSPSRVTDQGEWSYCHLRGWQIRENDHIVTLDRSYYHIMWWIWYKKYWPPMSVIDQNVNTRDKPSCWHFYLLPPWSVNIFIMSPYHCVSVCYELQ